MIKKTITYTDYDGNEHTEDFYFNISKAELMEMELTTTGGLSNVIQRIVNETDIPRMVELFQTLIKKSYGVKSLDGKKFVKNEQLLEDFLQSEAYSELYMELLSDADAATDFVNGIIPSDLQEAAKKQELSLNSAS